MNDMHIRITPRMFWFVGSFLGGALVMLLCFLVFAPGSIERSALRQSDLNPNSSYTLIDPIIGVKGGSALGGYGSLQDSISAIINRKSSTVEVVSVAFRDINLTEGFTINPDEKYTAASLLKIPIMITYYKLAEQNPLLLSERVVYTGAEDVNLQETFVSPIKLTKGGSYTVEELIEHMIKYSDNNAAQLLVDKLGDETQIFETLKDLGVESDDLNPDSFSVGSNILFFRVLYNSSYLDRYYSQKALELLTETDFKGGLSAGLPGTITIAEKFGESTQIESSKNKVARELHNCGIVYYPKHPYILCVMTKGTDFADLQDVISSVSRTIFGFVQSKYH